MNEQRYYWYKYKISIEDSSNFVPSSVTEEAKSECITFNKIVTPTHFQITKDVVDNGVDKVQVK